MATTFYATNNFTGDGTTVNWNINFADGYIDTTNVKARYLDNTGSYVDIAISSVAGNVVTISPAVANGQEFQIYRDTEKRFPLVDFSDGAILNEANLDTLATQAVMVSAEAFDQSNNGVRIAGDSLVVAQGIDAKAQLALDNSVAAVATANAIDGKAQTALDSSAAAVVTANAAASTAAGAVNTANTALSTANDAADDAATAITTANGAVTTANAATTTANAASVAAAAATTTANNAANNAAAAVSTAGTALSTANTASTNASAAVTTANAAKTTAEGIEAKADSALAASANAVSTANAAEATANAIDGKATDALDTADSAVATANAASATASSAATDASTALSTVTAADAKAQTALDNVASLDAATMKKAANLSDIADKAAAWLNVRPIGATPLAGDPVDALDAATKGSSEAYASNLDTLNRTWTQDYVFANRTTTVNGLTGGEINGETRVKGARVRQITDAPGTVNVGDYINAVGFRVTLKGRGGTGDPEGAFATFYLQEHVGTNSSVIIDLNGFGSTNGWVFQSSGNAVAPGSWVPNSDARLKKDKRRISDPLDKMRGMGGYTWTRLDTGLWGIGFIAQEVSSIFPDAVSVGGDRILQDGTTVAGVLSPDTYGVAAALHHEAILALMDKIAVLEAKVEALTNGEPNV